ncbi:MAG: hypothetical protein IMY72_04300 [Bacteroidetes bacterium]|nr:hypothetical protein [Bacteroidota bacterium]
MKDENKKFPEGHFVGLWMGIGIAVFTGLGLFIGNAFKNSSFVSMGPIIGVAFGILVGQAVEAKNKREGRIRTLYEKEKKRKKILVLLGLALLIIGFTMFFFMYN